MTPEQMQRLTFIYLVTRDLLPWGAVKDAVRRHSTMTLGLSPAQRWHLLTHALADLVDADHGVAMRRVSDLWEESRATEDRQNFTSPAGLAMARELLDEWQAGVRPCAEQVLVVG
jgi:hypothetical protein